MITFPNAKINLGLNIVARRPDGYHDIETVFLPIALTDVLEAVPATGSQATLTCYGRTVDCPVEQNLVMRAWRLMRQECGVPPVEMHLYKHIPDGAGLGGGSSDATAMLMLLNGLFRLGLDSGQLAALAARLGADCPFFVHNRPLMATGTGNVFAPVQVRLTGKALLLVKPDVAVSTREAYARVTPRPSEVPIPQILQQPVEQWGAMLHNDFEPSAFAAHPELAAIKRQLTAAGALYASMSGSGSSLFGIFERVKLAEEAAKHFAHTLHYVIPL